MTFLRQIYRLIALAAWSVLMIILTIPFHGGGWDGIKKITRIAQLWSRGAVRIVNLKVKVFGDIDKEVPVGLVVSNHQSYVDIITHGMFFPLRYAPKSDVRKMPVLGSFIAISHPVWVDRHSRQSSKRTSEEFIETMKRDMYLIVYPEGTSSDGRQGVLPFKSTPFEAVMDENLPIYPVLIRYPEVPGRDTVCWYGDMTFFPHMWKALGRPDIDVELHILPPVRPNGMSRKEMAAHMHEMMDTEYRRITG